MSEASDKAFDYIVGVEGGLSMDPNDRGNWTGGTVGVGLLKGTKYGISAAAHPALDIASLTEEDARSIFLSEYWGPIHGDGMPYPLALCVADDAYNHGVDAAVRTLQASLLVPIDGQIGPRTLGKAVRGDTRANVLMFQACRARRYAKDPAFPTFGFGWMHDRVLGTTLAALGA